MKNVGILRMKENIGEEIRCKKELQVIKEEEEEGKDRWRRTIY